MKIKYLVLVLSFVILIYAIYQSFLGGILSSYEYFMLSFVLFFIYKLK